MKKIFLVLLPLIVLSLLVSFLIPSVQKNNVFIGNTFENLISSIMKPDNWIKWDSAVSRAWKQDSLSCRFREDTVHHISRINIPGKEIIVTQVNYLLYHVEEIKNFKNAEFIFSIVPYAGNDQSGSFHQAQINYAQNSRLLYKILPFLKSSSFTDKTIAGLKAYLDSPARFYGLPIELKPVSDSIFLTQGETIGRHNDIFTRLPYLFDQLDSFARAHQVKPIGSKNISFKFLPGDTTKILAGILIPSVIEGDYLVKCQQLHSNQFLVTGIFEGLFRDRLRAYRSIDKFIIDHQLMETSSSYERYLSALPLSDSSMVRIELTYPLRTSIAQ